MKQLALKDDRVNRIREHGICELKTQVVTLVAKKKVVNNEY